MGRWHDVWSEALASAPLVGVYRTIAAHVGREPTRSEVSAGRRAARRMAENGDAVLVGVVVAPAPGRRAKDMLVLARPGVDVSDEEALATAAGGCSRTGPDADPTQVVPGLITTLENLAATAKLLDVSGVAPATASELEAAMEEPLKQVAKLRNRLRWRARMQ